MAQARSRDYEVSIWTLQDEFISVLKPTGVVNKGQIERAILKIVDDGTQEFSFSIPMYIFIDDKRIENPIWKNTQNGNVIADMRKIKVTFNRMTAAEKTFEFLITDITERHETDQLYCDVNCEGMAFHELGKRGYSIKLLSEDFYLESEQYFTHETDSKGRFKVSAEPRATLSYWLNKFLPVRPVYYDRIDPQIWYYKIEMDWSSYANGINRKKDEVYEEEFVSSWKTTTNENNEEVYMANAIESAKIKERLVDLKESNIYNLTQDLAETFGVFCRYEYEHNTNLEITSRTVVFYNNYMKENEGYIDLTYPYETSAVTRVRDSKDLTTKMYVTQVEDPNSDSGVLSIMDVPANKSREEYLLNFEYLYSIGGITKEQYNEIAVYETRLGELNKQIVEKLNPLVALQNKVIDLEAEIANRESSITASRETWRQYDDKLNALGEDQSGTITRGNSNPVRKILVHSDDASKGYYVDFTEEGVKPETVHIWNTVKSSTEPIISTASGSPCKELSGEKVYDKESGSLIQIRHITAPAGVNLDNLYSIYATFSYSPFEYYNQVKQTMAARTAADTAAKEAAETKLLQINNQIHQYEAEREQLIEEKQIIIKAFDKMMGSAIRESYWQPENYNDYGDNYTDTLHFSNTLTTVNNGESTLTSAIWEPDWKQTGTNTYETLAFPDEQLSFYEGGIVNLERIYYPVIDLSGHEGFVKENYDKLTVMFYDFHGYESDADKRKPQNLRQFMVGSGAQYGFALKNGRIVPVLIVTGAADLIGGVGTDNNVNSLKRLLLDTNNTQVGVVETTILNRSVNISVKNGSWYVRPTTGAIGWLNVNSTQNRYTTAINLYYPRIKVGSMAMKTAEDQLGLTYAGDVLENYKDYYILSRDDSTWRGNIIDTSNAAYYVTIKPETFMRFGNYTNFINFKFCISNANIAIYLDAVQVLKENSQPKVSYTVNASFVNTNFIYDLYNKLNRICNINDSELHFENVQGYISEIDLDCDIPANDSIEIKNYKTKFEDLFSSIVAQTQSMKKSEYAIGLAAGAFTSSGDLRESVMESSWRRVDFNYAFNQGKLTINEKDGIWGTSDNGVVAFRGGGIFTATNKDDAGNWIWNTGILPQGINADLITTGRLDTNKINIYSGDNIRFQFNSDGIFAYRDYNFIDPNYATRDTALINAAHISLGENTHQFVTMNQEGLFLVAEGGAKYLEGNTVTTLADGAHINRVSVSWDGFTIRDWNDDRVFYADDTGNLTLKGAFQIGEDAAGKFYLAANKNDGLVIKYNQTEYFRVNKFGSAYFRGTGTFNGAVNATSLSINGESINNYISTVAQKGITHGTATPSGTATVGDLYYEEDAGWTWTYTTSGWKPQTVAGTALVVNPETGVISVNANNQLNLGSNKTVEIFGSSAVNIYSGTTATGTAALLLQNGKITMNSTSGLEVNGSNIIFNSGSFQVWTTVQDPYQEYASLIIDDNGLSMSDGSLLHANLSKGTFSIYNGATLSTADAVFSITEDHTEINNLQVVDIDISGNLTLNGQPVYTGGNENDNNSNLFSNKRIIYSDSTDAPPGKDFIWIKPITAPSNSGDQTITWKSSTDGSRRSITSASSDNFTALNFSGTSIGTGDSYSYVAKVKVYGTGSGSRKIYRNGTKLTFGSIELTLASQVTMTPGSNATLTFTADGVGKISNGNGRITLSTSGSGAYVNLERDWSNSLKITVNSGSSAASATSTECKVYYVS